MTHRLPTPTDQREAFGLSLDECAECGALVHIPYVASCNVGDLCSVCSPECKTAHQDAYGLRDCADCQWNAECAAHVAESAAVFAARELVHGTTSTRGRDERRARALEAAGLTQWPACANHDRHNVNCTPCYLRREHAENQTRPNASGHVTYQIRDCEDCALVVDNDPEYQRFLAAMGGER